MFTICCSSFSSSKYDAKIRSIHAFSCRVSPKSKVYGRSPYFAMLASSRTSAIPPESRMMLKIRFVSDCSVIFLYGLPKPSVSMMLSRYKTSLSSALVFNRTAQHPARDPCEHAPTGDTCISQYLFSDQQVST